MIHELIIATHNRGKLTEIQAILKEFDIKCYSLDDFQLDDVAETGLTFVENALLKARSACLKTGLPALGDDSGLVIDALNGAPGLYSARYAGVHGNFDANIQKVLQEMQDATNRKAYFHCTMVLLKSAQDPSPLIVEGRWHGEILTERGGLNGFGYDPVMYIPELQCSVAELDSATKNRLSHRGQALRQLVSLMKA